MEDFEKARQLLQTGEPEEALNILWRIGRTPQVKKLEDDCKKVLKEQYLWILKDAEKNGHYNRINVYIEKYVFWLGHDDEIAKYEAIKRPRTIGDLAWLPLLSLLLSTIINILAFLFPYNFDSISYTTTSAYIFSCIYAVSMTFVLAKTDNENGKLFSSSNILLLIWCIATLVFYVYFITGNITCDWDSNYWWYRMERKEGNIYVAMGLASIAMIWALLKKRAKTVLYKSPLLLVIIAMSIDFLRTIYFFAFCSEWEPGNFCEDYIPVFDNIRNVLMIISCFMIYRNAKKQFD